MEVERKQRRYYIGRVLRHRKGSVSESARAVKSRDLVIQTKDDDAMRVLALYIGKWPQCERKYLLVKRLEF